MRLRSMGGFAKLGRLGRRPRGERSCHHAENGEAEAYFQQALHLAERCAMQPLMESTCAALAKAPMRDGLNRKPHRARARNALIPGKKK